MVGDIRHIFVVESLGDEKKTGEELYLDTISRRIDLFNKPISHAFHAINSKDDLRKLLSSILTNIKKYQNGLLIHLEMHGEENKKGLVLNTNELSTWKELIELLRPINVACCNQLFITMATCYGRHMYLGVDPILKSPFSAYVSASNKVKSGEITDKFALLFEMLIDKGNLISAYFEMQKTGSSFFFKDRERTFEDAHKSVRIKMASDKKYRIDFIARCIEETKKAGEPVPDDVDDDLFEIMIEMALDESYKRNKETFNFNC